MRKELGLLLALTAAGCGTKTEEPVPAKEISHAAPRNDTLLLLADGQKSVQVIADHLLGAPNLPGGTLGEYETGGKPYQLFVLRAESNEDAALLLLSLKKAMPNASYIAHMGGYSGLYKDRRLYVYAKRQFLAGVVGLPDDEADPIARRLAARLQ